MSPESSFAAGTRVQVVRRVLSEGSDYLSLHGRTTGRRQGDLVEVAFAEHHGVAPAYFHQSELSPAPLRIHLYLDIDGVLNPIALEGETLADVWGGLTAYTAAYGEQVAPALVARLNRLVAEHSITGHWLTTWMQEAPEFGQLVGLAGSESWPVLEAKSSLGWAWPKFSSVRAHVEATAPDLAIWFDDHLAEEPEARQWADEHPNVLAFSPKKTHGVTPEMIDEIEDAVAVLNAG